MRIIITSLVAIVVGLGISPATSLAQPAEPTPADLRKTCADAMNKNPSFAKDIVAAADKQAQQERDAATLKAHTDAQDRIAKNEKHVILAYAAMWLVAVGFVLFLWRRQQALKSEIAQLRRDLDAAAKGAT